MATPRMDYLRSPLDNFYKVVPQGDESALKQAFYNAGATLFVILVCSAAVSVYFVLEIFLRPLMWALLCGTVLHPVKNSLTYFLRGWLKGLTESGTPFVIGVVVLPLNVIDNASQTIAGAIMRHIKAIVVIGIGFPVTYLLYHFGPLLKILSLLKAVFWFAYQALGLFSSFWIWTFVIAYFLAVVFYWNNQSSSVLRYLSVPIWIAILFHLATNAGALRIPIVVMVVTAMIVGLGAEIKEAKFKKRKNGEEQDLPDVSPTEKLKEALWRVFSGRNRMEARANTSNLSLETSQSDSIQESHHSDEENANVEPSRPPAGGHPIGVPLEEAQKPKTLNLGTRGQGQTKGQGQTDSIHDDSAQSKPMKVPARKKRSLSDHCFIWLLWALVLVHVWRHFWLIQLLPVLLVVWIIKTMATYALSNDPVKEKLAEIQNKTSAWVDDRRDALVPVPIQGLTKLAIRGDRKITSGLESSMDAIMSTVVILGVLVGAVLFAVFMAVQVHHESMHLVKVTSDVLNNSLHPELKHWLPESDQVQKAMDSMVGNVYVYGRQWISTQVNYIAGENANKTHVEAQALALYDRLYESWFTTKNATAVRKTGTLTRSASFSDLSMTNLTSAWSVMKNTDFSGVVSFVQDNIGTLKSVFESLWIFIKGNMNLALSVLWTTISLVFGGGTALLNFILSAVVFLTTLFYLLSFSGEHYKPVDWLVSISPGSGSTSKLGEAVEEGISGVFKASMKMATFYGLYTWLTHTVFGINIIFIPSALAAMFGAIPFLGTYWAALPAVIELWLVQGELFMAVTLFICQLLPTMFVDTAIYSDIKGGGHPYLTGLAIAGGMYCFGLEGAIIGPILLCCLLVAVNVYSTMLKQPAQGNPEGNRQP